MLRYRFFHGFGVQGNIRGVIGPDGDLARANMWADMTRGSGASRDDRPSRG